MESKRWFSAPEAFTPNRELFRSERRFSLWAQTVSHGQTLLRSRRGDGPTRVDLLFKPVAAMKLRQNYDGLVVRCATVEEVDEVGGLIAPTSLSDEQVFILETGGHPDYLVSHAFGWCEDSDDDHEPTRFSGTVEEGEPPWSRRVLFGVDGGLTGSAATLADLGEAVRRDCETAEERATYRYVYVLMLRTDPSQQDSPVAVFLTRGEAERQLARKRAVLGMTWRIEQVPVPV